MLIIFSGVTGTGKTALSRRLARELRAVYLRDKTMSPPIMAAGEGIETVLSLNCVLPAVPVR